MNSETIGNGGGKTEHTVGARVETERVVTSQKKKEKKNNSGILVCQKMKRARVQSKKISSEVRRLFNRWSGLKCSREVMVKIKSPERVGPLFSI